MIVSIRVPLRAAFNTRIYTCASNDALLPTYITARSREGASTRLDRLTEDLLKAVHALQRPRGSAATGIRTEGELSCNFTSPANGDLVVGGLRGLLQGPAQDCERSLDGARIQPVRQDRGQDQASNEAAAREATVAAAEEAVAEKAAEGERLSLLEAQLGRVALAVRSEAMRI